MYKNLVIYSKIVMQVFSLLNVNNCEITARVTSAVTRGWGRSRLERRLMHVAIPHATAVRQGAAITT